MEIYKEQYAWEHDLESVAEESTEKEDLQIYARKLRKLERYTK